MKPIKLVDFPTDAPEHLSKSDAKKITKERINRIADLHHKMIADGDHAVLVVLQGMDASGKDGAMRNLFGPCAPYNFRTESFKKPTDKEFAHDFLWRVHQVAPQKGEIVVFNRSHYEDILIQRVHGWIDEKRVKNRMESINAFEKLLQYDNNTTILKFYLHTSYEQQEIELQQRIDEPEKHYKHNPGDWKERAHWDKYMRAYEDIFNWSDTPWNIVGVDQRWYRDYQMSAIILDAMEKLDLKYPPLKED